MAGGGELSAAFRALAEDAAQAGESIGKSMGRWFTDTADGEDENVARTLAADEENARALNAVRPKSGEALPGAGDGSGGEGRIAQMMSGDERAAGGGKKPLPDWLKKRWEDGEQFNRENHSRYPHNEVELATKKRVDSYNPGREIVERKNTQLSEVKESTAKSYIDSLREKYKPGQLIGDTPKNRAADLAGKKLAGDHILEVPPQNNDIPQNVLNHATDHDVTIRDTNGKEYN